MTLATKQIIIMLKYFTYWILLLSISIVAAQESNGDPGAISSRTVVQSRAASVQFWTASRMQAAEERMVVLPMQNISISRSLPISNDPSMIVSGRNPDRTSATLKALNPRGRQVLTTGRVFWSCDRGLSSCSAGVVPSTSGDLIVTAAHCIFDTTTLQWLINCKWIFVPGYINGTAPYGIWTARQGAALKRWTQSVPDYNYDVAFVAVDLIRDKHLTQITGSQSLGFNQARRQSSYSFGYPVNIGGGQSLQSCSGIPAPSQYTRNGYIGQGLSNCGMGGGCSGGPWLQSFNETAGVGIVYSLNSFTYSPAPNTIHGPVFDTNVQLLWNYMTAR
jgi:hypothetical protein